MLAKSLGVTVVLVLVTRTVGVSGQDVDLSRFEDIREPRITSRAAETVLQVRAVGDPSVVGGAAFGLLFQLYYSSPVTPKAPPGPTVKARWPTPPGAPREEWVGLYALPVPEGMTLPEGAGGEGLEPEVTTWEYGEVVEVLYIGPYERETPTLDRLRAVAEAEGYEVLPGHEEEYVRGPTMAGPGNPEEYVTILRYRVRLP